MAKKCSSCGFTNNPDDAHYCGKCGKNMGIYEWWVLYNAWHYVTVEHSKLQEYERYEQEAKSSIWKKMWKSVQDFWTGLEIPKWIILLFGLISICIFIGISCYILLGGVFL